MAILLLKNVFIRFWIILFCESLGVNAFPLFLITSISSNYGQNVVFFSAMLLTMKDIGVLTSLPGMSMSIVMFCFMKMSSPTMSCRLPSLNPTISLPFGLFLFRFSYHCPQTSTRVLHLVSPLQLHLGRCLSLWSLPSLPRSFPVMSHRVNLYPLPILGHPHLLYPPPCLRPPFCSQDPLVLRGRLTPLNL